MSDLPDLAAIIAAHALDEDPDGTVGCAAGCDLRWPVTGLSRRESTLSMSPRCGGWYQEMVAAQRYDDEQVAR